MCEFQTGLEFRSEPFIPRGHTLLKKVRGKCFTSKNFSPLTSFASFSPAPSLFRGFFFNSCRQSRTLLVLFFLRELPGFYPYVLLIHVQTSPEGLIKVYVCPFSVYDNLLQLNMYKGIGETITSQVPGELYLYCNDYNHILAPEKLKSIKWIIDKRPIIFYNASSNRTKQSFIPQVIQFLNKSLNSDA